MSERTTIRLPQPLLAAAKRRASADGRTVTSLIIEGLHRVLDEARPEPAVELPPVCRESSKSRQPFPLIDLKALDEDEDMARLNKLAQARPKSR